MEVDTLLKICGAAATGALYPTATSTPCTLPAACMPESQFPSYGMLQSQGLFQGGHLFQAPAVAG